MPINSTLALLTKILRRGISLMLLPLGDITSNFFYHSFSMLAFMSFYYDNYDLKQIVLSFRNLLVVCVRGSIHNYSQNPDKKKLKKTPRAYVILAIFHNFKKRQQIHA